MTNKINGIDLSKYFKNHYDSWGRLYCIEYKGNSLELQNDIKRLQEENEKLKKRQITKNGFICDCEQNAKYKQALEEIRNEIGDLKNINRLINLQKILDIIDEVLNDRD